MAFYTDDEVTPRPFRVVSSDGWADRSPYIPRRKSSQNEGSVQGTLMPTVTRLSEAPPDKGTPTNSHIQKSRFPIDGYDPPLGQGLHQIPLQRGPELRRPQLALKQSSSRRFLHRMFSNLPFPSTTSRPQSTHSSASQSKLGRAHPRSESTTSSRASSTLSVITAPSSSRDNTVRRRRQLAVASIRSVLTDSPNPLRVPPPSFRGPRREKSTNSETTASMGSTNEGSVESLDVPAVAYSQIHYLTLAGNEQSKNGSPCGVWVIVDVLCSLNQSTDPERLDEEQRPTKSFNNPGLLKRVTLSLAPLQNCQIITVLGQCTTATLSPDQTFTAIILVSLHKSLLSATRPSPQKENGRAKTRSLQKRPTSDVLSDELLSQLLGKFKRTLQAKDEQMDEPILRASVTYEHSLFPSDQEIKHEATVTVKPAAICNSQHSSLRKRRLEKDQGSPHFSATEHLNVQQTQSAAERIIRVLRNGLRFDSHARDATSHPVTDPGQAVKLLNDFFAAATRLSANTKRTLEMLKFRYSMLPKNNDQTLSADSTASPKRYNLLDRRKLEKGGSVEPRSHIPTPHKAELEYGRRDAFEIDREEAHFEQGLTDITNRAQPTIHNQLSSRTHLLDHGNTPDPGKHDAIPAPLFSPRRTPSLVPLPRTDLTTNWSTRSRDKNHFYLRRQHSSTNIGSAQFYATEVEQMAREAFGGTPTTCHPSEFLYHSAENDELAGGRHQTAAAAEEEGNDQAKMIWERMRISSEASGTSAKSTEVRYGDESADEAEMARECKVLGAPWLA